MPDALNADRCWGLKDLPTWCFNDDDGAVEKSQENINKWYKAQMHLYELILESFQHSDPQVLNDFSVDAVTDRLLAGTFAEGLPAKVQRAGMVVFAPFGTPCYFAIKARYEEGGTANGSTSSPPLTRQLCSQRGRPSRKKLLYSGHRSWNPHGVS